MLTEDGRTANPNDGDSFAVYVYTGADAVVGEEGSTDSPLTSAGLNLNDETGTWDYVVGFLEPGEYTVAFTCQAADDSIQVPDDGIDFIESNDSPTTVVADQDSRVDFP